MSKWFYKFNYKNINTLLASIVFLSELLIVPLISIFGITSNANLYILIIEILLLGLNFLFHFNSIKINLNFIILFSLFSIMAFVSIISYDTFSFPQAIYYFIVPFIVFSQPIDGKKFLECSMYLSIVSIFCINSIFSFFYEDFGQISMGNSYAIFSAILVGLMHFVFYRKQSNIVLKLIYCLDFYYCIKLIISGTRGAIFALCILFLLILVLRTRISPSNKKNSDLVYNVKKNNALKRNIVITISLIVLMVVYLNSDSILITLGEICNNLFGKIPSFINKSINLINFNNLNNGRTDLYRTAFSLIGNNVFFGYGVRTFSLYTTYPWPHNLFIQLLFEGGILFSSLPFCFLIIFIYKCLFMKFNNASIQVFCITLFVSLLPRYFVSNDIWLGVHFWIVMGACCQFINIFKRFNKERVLCQ